jgi:dTDP-4-dehydrorhamnose 3,5-epimerase
MKIIETKLPGVLIIEPDVFGDSRGFFMETYHKERYRTIGINAEFVQDNTSFSTKGTLRGLHFQYPHSQAKLVQVFMGEVFDVAVDIRKGSPAFGQWFGVTLSSDNKQQLFIPVGFAHGFCVLSETALFSYKCTEFYSPADERGILWSDPDIGIEWPVKDPLLSDKDEKYPRFKDLNSENLPPYINQ